MLHNRSCCISWCIHVASCRKMHVNSVFLSRIIHSGCCRKSSVYQHFPYFRHSYQKCFAGSIPVSRLEKRTIPNRYRSFFRALAGLESSMSTLRSGPRSPRSPGPRAPSRASYPLIFSKSFFFMLHQINFYCFTLYR